MYDYFGNTSLRVKHLLYNFESQLLLFEELFKNAGKNDTWSNDSSLQMQYLELLQAHNLLENRNKSKDLGTKDARVKSAPLEDFNLINRKEKLITKQGYELLSLIKNQAYKIDNDFLQMDLISLFFLKASLNFKKSENLLLKYLEIFRIYKGELSKELFIFLPLINNFKDAKSFIKAFNEKTIFKTLLPKKDLELFLKDLKEQSFRVDYFKTAKGDNTAHNIILTLKEVFLKYQKSKDKKIFENFLQERQKFTLFKRLYLAFITAKKKKEDKIKDLTHFTEAKDFNENFFELIFKARIMNNLKDYFDLNQRYLSLCGIFEFSADKVSLSEIFKLILRHSKFKELLEKLAFKPTSKELLSEYFEDKEFKEFFKEKNIFSLKDLKTYKKEQELKRLKNLVEKKFSKENLLYILSLFEDRKNDDELMNLVSKEATIPTIFEYVIALVWHYIDENNLERILQANLSLDNELLPKSHALGGEADFVYPYESHSLMIEVSLTQRANQRRAEMESVSRHLGNLLLSLEPSKAKQSFAIFIAPYLDKNVLNDFRSRIYCYFENEQNFIKGMHILPLSTRDLAHILRSNLSYKELLPKFYELFKDKEDFGSKWYKESISKMIQDLGVKNELQ
ncbi:AlwI family type II restriction endonuclease [Campylobacter sp. MIT 99-7217]|uniref:AlwI family type II restriction endonuclease n=1 Tax=Campylobacter sp. MIT 99-7217 TaxID=535091 RepID=UPI0011578915|nr:AlwI family type II restriction endonuclease [Campylobacter sp. MIT 99-7217]TQR31382.1 AlwI family type II restriction endonuclease [Campylobacter sp. MIT 99-7217]